MNIDDRGRKAAASMKATVSNVPIPPSPQAIAMGVAKKATSRGWMRSLEWSAGLAVVILILGFATQGGLMDMVAGQFASSSDGELGAVDADALGVDGHHVVIVDPAHESVQIFGYAIVSVEATPGLEVLVNGSPTYLVGEVWKAEVVLDDGWNEIVAVGRIEGEVVADHAVSVHVGAVAPSTTEPEPTTTTQVEPEPTTTTTEPKPEPTTTTKPKVTTTTKSLTAHVIQITSPANGFETAEAVITVTGTSTGEGHFTLYVDGAWYEFVPSDAGNWEQNVELAPGWNTVWAKVYVGDTKVAYDTIEVYRSSGEVVDYAISIASPANGFESDAESLLFSGTATVGAGDFVLYVGGEQHPFEVNAEGDWSILAPVSPGWNTVYAKMYVGGEKVAFDSVEVYRVVPLPDFTATQVNGSSTVASDVFWGLATPGGEVKVFSEYGWVVVAADVEGNYEAAVAFEGAPIGVEFSVYVKDLATGRKIFFGFTLLASEA
jgi:hypothetical protein